jgi:CheY-like chemotaxis protein/anti-sigma regulatory factor (Ser/Thr protein kinase)
MGVVDALAVVAEVVDLVQPLAGGYEVSVTTTVDHDEPPLHVHADQQRVKQVLINLLTNGVKYNHTGGSVQVECRARDVGEVAFEVTDTGPGISTELLPRLFLPFDRLGAEGTDVEGTGLGLALADGLARAMGGRIEVLTTPGAGSTFTLVLRKSTAEDAFAEDVQREPEVPVEGEGQRVLLVEDNPTNAALMSRMVALRPGCRLEVARDGGQALAAARREAPVLVFLDLHLPDMGGEQVLRELRAMPSCAEVPVVVVTADASAKVHTKMAGLGSNGFLTKPIDLDDVLGWIDRALSGAEGQ